MAHYAQLDENNNVISVRLLDDFYEMNDIGELDEEKAICRLRNENGRESIWKKTSYGGKIRGKFASVGGTYHAATDEFRDPKPYESWVYDDDANEWKPPTPRPGVLWDWDEENLKWVEEEQDT